jgi:hypothetical protein
MAAIGERAIRAGDFAGVVPASRGAHCRPLHPRLASLCPATTKLRADSRFGRPPAFGRSDPDRRHRPLLSDPTHRRTEDGGQQINVLQVCTILNSRREFRGAVAVI